MSPNTTTLPFLKPSGSGGTTNTNLYVKTVAANQQASVNRSTDIRGGKRKHKHTKYCTCRKKGNKNRRRTSKNIRTKRRNK